MTKRKETTMPDDNEETTTWPEPQPDPEAQPSEDWATKKDDDNGGDDNGAT